MLIPEPLNTCSRWPKGLCKFKGGVGGGGVPWVGSVAQSSPCLLKNGELSPAVPADFEDGGRWLLEIVPGAAKGTCSFWTPPETG